MRVRLYKPEDAAALAALYARSVRALGPRDYAAEQVEAWASLAPTAEQMHARGADGRTVMVAVDGADRPVAFGDLEADGHIDLFYCAPEVAGTGVASALYEALEAKARALGVARLHVEASEAARRLFLRKGFAVRVRRDLVIRGVPIHNYAMEKAL